jgi:acetyl/propionyl-CoA carboxylase alpha subunit
MRLVLEKAGLQEAFDAASREGKASFGDDRLIVEKHVSPARHVEVQILGDGREAVAVGDRECSLQRRYQKVIEEGPAASVSPAVREEMHRSAVKLARAVGYRSAGTVEFLLGPEGLPYFLEVNTRLQVEHPVTEATTGLDLVAEQIELARGGALPVPAGPRGHAIEARVNAEDPHSGFLPQAGRVLMAEWPQRPGVRVDSGVREGSDVPPDYDPLLAKVIAWGKDREQARRRLVEALRESVLLGLATNLSFLLQVLDSGFFVRGETFTTTLESVAWPRPPVPAAAAEAARRAASPGTPPAEPRSPWQSMGGFRVGS